MIPGLLALGLGWIALSPASLASDRACPTPLGPDTSIAKIRDLIERSEARGRPIGSIDELIGCLPEEMRSHSTLVYESRSLQEASPESPRAILFNGRLYATFNDNPEFAGHSTLELMEFRPAERDFQLFEAEETTDASGVRRVSLLGPNPPKCLFCHHADPRPIWSAAVRWPGVFGSFDDYLGESDHSGGVRVDPVVVKYERKALTDLKRRLSGPQGRGSRYRHLIFPASDARETASPYRVTTNSQQPSPRFRPNLLLSSLVTAQTAKRAERRLEASAYFSGLRWTLLALLTEELRDEGVVPLISCASRPAYTQLQGQLSDFLSRSGVSRRYADGFATPSLGLLVELLEIEPVADLPGGDLHAQQTAPERLYRFNARGFVSQLSYLASFVNGALQAEHAGFLGLLKMSNRHLTRRHGQEEPLLSKLEDVSEPYGYFWAQDSFDDRHCDFILTRSLEELAQLRL